MERTRSVLIRMPTGTGKSGVIAAVCQNGDISGRILVVAPSNALRIQLANDIEERFWRRSNTKPPASAKKVRRFVGAAGLRRALDDPSPELVIVGTIQSLESTKRTDPELHRSLGDAISLVVVDEGHREPATEWSTAVRELRRRVALFTATPYRNDHKVFNVDAEDAYAYTHDLAEQEGFLRQVDFETLGGGDSPSAFVASILSYLERVDHRRLSNVKQPRVIIRCGSGESVKAIVEALVEQGETAVGIHSSFTNSDLYRRSVPPLDDPDDETTFWVHQDMLLEGIDQPEFCVLALYEPMRNGRALVQQVGRILRNPGRSSETRAAVLSYPQHHQQRKWELYRKYETAFEANPDLAEKRRLFDESVAITPESWMYEGSSYRGRLDIELGPAAAEVQYPLTAYVFRPAESFDESEFEEHVLAGLAERDLDVRPRTLVNEDGSQLSDVIVEVPNETTHFVPFVQYNHPRLLAEHYLMQFEIGFVLWRRAGDFLLVVSSHRAMPEHIASYLPRVDAKTLRRAFRDTSDPRISRIDVANTLLGDHSIRRRAVVAKNVRDLAPALDDHMQVLAHATGYTRLDDGRARRRQVGFSTGRVSDPGVRDVPLEVLEEWLDVVAKNLATAGRPTPTAFGRFAEFADPPARTEPKNILIDLGADVDRFTPSKDRVAQLKALGGAAPDSLILEDSCLEIDGVGRFVLRIDGDPDEVSYAAHIAYDPDRQRYTIDCDSLDAAFIRHDDDGNRMKAGVSALINAQQALRVIPSSSRRVYARGHWYEPRLDALNLDEVLVPVPALALANSEKGSRTNRGQWDPASVFGVIDRSHGPSTSTDVDPLAEHLGTMDRIICDDVVLSEVADFVAIRDGQRAVLIHAKAFKQTRKRSASAFHEVCGQAIKNLDAVSPYGDLPQTHVKYWAKPWSVPTTTGTVSRLRKVPKKERGQSAAAKSQNAYDQFERAVSNPNAQREVWIVLGNGFSLQEFEAERSKANPRPEIIQIAYLLQATWADVRRIGAAFRVFCSP